MRPVYTSKVKVDDFIRAASRAFDYSFTGESSFTGWEKPDVPKEFKIGLIVGPSGSGKTLLLRQFGKEETPFWEPDMAIVSHFVSPEEAIDRLMAVGLNSIPSWCRPFWVLSSGEQFRANLARKLKDGAVIDEYTSVVDRNVAKSASIALKRYVENKGLKNIVLASCHRDIIEWLEPDWVFDTSNGSLAVDKFFRHPPIQIEVYPTTRDSWKTFANHHYLSGNLSKSCRCYIAIWNTGDERIVVGFLATLAMPNGYMKNAWREHRLVILPDFQGMGIGPRLSDTIAQLYLDEGKRYFGRTAHPRLGYYRDHSPLWKKTSKYRRQRLDVKRNTERGKENWHNWIVDTARECYSHEYIGQKTA